MWPVERLHHTRYCSVHFKPLAVYCLKLAVLFALAERKERKVFSSVTAWTGKWLFSTPREISLFVIWLSIIDGKFFSYLESYFSCSLDKLEISRVVGMCISWLSTIIYAHKSTRKVCFRNLEFSFSRTLLSIFQQRPVIRRSVQQKGVAFCGKLVYNLLAINIKTWNKKLRILIEILTCVAPCSIVFYFFFAY